MTSRLPFYLLVAFLVSLGFGLSVFKHFYYGVPWLPDESKKVWDIEAKIQFEAKGQPVKVSFTVPDTQHGLTLINETTASAGYGVDYFNQNDSRRAEWAIREASGVQSIYYKAQFLVDPQAKPAIEMPHTVVPPSFSDASLTAANLLIKTARQRSADDIGFTREIIKLLNEKENPTSALLLANMSKDKVVDSILALSEIPSRIVGVIELEDGRRRQSIRPMNYVWDGEGWQLFDLGTAALVNSSSMLIWDDSNLSLLDLVGASKGQVYFSMISREISASQATAEKVNAEGLLNLSIHSLPLEDQAMFKTILLIPIGALLVVFLRVIIGLKTSGTFMPVLIAAAFMQTQLVTGIVGFLLIVGVGLIIRSYLSKLNLLLVSRISAVIITVILIISAFTVLAYKLGLTEGLSITFFPMIILSWTIERMSIIWEEEGPKEVALQGGGSLMTAVLVYLAMSNPYIQHLTFNFIGLQFVLLAGILLLGTYTGYRLTELRRFKPLVEA